MLKQIQKILYDKETTLKVINNHYKEWVADDQMLIFEQTRFRCKPRQIASLCPKRGNPKYAHMMRRRIQELSLPFEYEEKLQEKLQVQPDETHTSILFVSLTYHTEICDYKTAWANISKQWNKFMSNIRKQYGRALTVRVYEATEKGYPHIHCIIYLPDQSFPTFQKWSKKEQRDIWRIPYKEKEKMVKGKKTRYWHSNIDVQGVTSMAKAFKYIGKYLGKCSDISQKALNTLSLMWAFHKRSFSIGNKFKEEIWKRYVATDLTRVSVSQTFSSQQTLDFKQLGGYGSEKWKMVAIMPKIVLNKVNLPPKNEWTYGLTTKQSTYVNYITKGRKPQKPEKPEYPWKNPFNDIGDLNKFCRNIIHKQLERKQANHQLEIDNDEFWFMDNEENGLKFL